MLTKSTQNRHLIMPKYAHLKVGGGIVQNVEYHNKVLYRAKFLNEAFGFLMLFLF